MTQGPQDAVNPERPVEGADPVVGPRTAERAGEQTAQSELDLGVVSTGSPQVDNALRRLESLGERPVADHVEAYEQVLADLTETMSDPVAVPARADGAPNTPR
ncbi:MAG: hypothetical protein ABI720_04655 [Actinomycetes bacterium]